MVETNNSQQIESSMQGEAKRPRRARGELGEFLEEIFNKYHNQLVALSKYKLKEAGAEDNEAANLSEDMVSTLYKNMLNGQASINIGSTESEIQADLVKLLEETISHYVTQANTKKRCPPSELVQMDEWTEKDSLSLAEKDKFIETIGNVPLEEILQEDLEKISPREAKVLKMRFGLLPYQKEHTLDEVAQEFAVTRERIRQIEAKALRKLRKNHEFKQWGLAAKKEQEKLKREAEQSDDNKTLSDSERLNRTIEIITLSTPALTTSFQNICRLQGNIFTVND